MGKLFDGKLVFTQIPLLLKYLPVTMELAVTAMIASLILGLLLALVKIKKVPVLKQLVSIYISVIRGTPVLVQLYVTYFGIPMLLKYINFKMWNQLQCQWSRTNRICIRCSGTQ